MRLDEVLYLELDRGVREGVFPCAVAEVRRNGNNTAWAAKGMTSITAGGRATRETLFDIASVTQAFMSTLVWRLHAQGVFSVDEPVRRYLPAFPGGDDVLVIDLLRHTSGLPSWYPYYEEPEISSRKALIDDIMLESLTPIGAARKKAVLSHIGSIVLGEVVEAAVGWKALRWLMESEVTGPLELESVRYLPADGRDRATVEGRPVAATAVCPWRGRVLRGEVHDDNTWVMGGISGNAGLFSTAADVCRLGVAWLQARRGELPDFLPQDVALRATTPSLGGKTPGFDIRLPRGSSVGTRMSPATFGHLGFTGCSIWCDPDEDLVIVLLSNRIHPSITNWAIREFRPTFHDVVVEAALSGK
jgi:CubicO group peptidase (beta-lactamase class C family)